MASPKFKLLMPCGYPPLYRIEGGQTFEGIRDAPSLRTPYGCWRSTLPPSLKELVFWFGELPPHDTVLINNFYHLGEFFVVSASIRKLLELHANCDFEVETIKTKHPKGEATEQLWAMKVKTVIDCIQPELSFAPNSSAKEVQYLSFSELAIETTLSTEDAPFFATKDKNTYYAYPDAGVQSVSMDFSVVPSGIKLFQPKYWPQHLVIEENFSKELERQCTGRAPGYYFWALEMSDIGKQYGSNMHALR